MALGSYRHAFGSSLVSHRPDKRPHAIRFDSIPLLISVCFTRPALRRPPPHTNADYRAGGKLGPPAPPPRSAPAACAQGVDVDAVRQGQELEDNDDPKFSQDRAAASRVLSDAVKDKEAREGGSEGGAGAAVGSKLSSTFWAELLD